MIRKTLTLLAIVTTPAGAEAQWILQQSGTEAEFRGISAANDRVVWAAGRDGTFARTVDGGVTWEADTVPGAASLFFIDVHAVSDSVAYLLGTHFDGGVGAIFKTTDAGASWVERYRNETPGVFFDGLAFWDAEHGIAFSDPVDGSFLIVTTTDGGATWTRVPPAALPAPLPGEAGFAASGTGIAVAGDSDVWIGTGGGRAARVLHSGDGGRSWTAVETPLAGGESAGIFGIAFRDSLNGAAVGGDYRQPNDSSLNVLRTTDGGRSWSRVGRSEPQGVRYGVTYVQAGASGEERWLLVAVGPSGWGYSTDDGATWRYLDSLGFNTVGAAPGGPVWAAGLGGRVARFSSSGSVGR
ncbi:MAG TPA: hypothetical protein VLC48_11325 [Gemmatimonadota bacterium]|nr:hypothetical protein [Gemmatimonadota bacterium]